MLSWSYFRTPDGRIQVFPSVVEATGDAECAHFLAVVVDLTARVGGPFVRRKRGLPPSWSDVYPAPRRSLERLIGFIFDEKPASVVTNLDIIRANAFRDGPRGEVYHFDSPLILHAYAALAFPLKGVTGGIKAGRFWWDGPVDELKQSILAYLKNAGYLGDLSDQRVYDCLDLVLTEQLKAVREGTIQSSADMTDSLRSFIIRRYSPKEISGLKYNWLRYDAFWSLMNKLTGLNAERMSAKVCGKTAYRVDSLVSELLRKIRGAGITDETYLRAYLSDAAFRKQRISLEAILNPPPTLYM